MIAQSMPNDSAEGAGIFDSEEAKRELVLLIAKKELVFLIAQREPAEYLIVQRELVILIAQRELEFLIAKRES